jgi:alkaline phosphatase
MNISSFLSSVWVAVSLLHTAGTVAGAEPTGSVIFFHPDGTSLNHWNAARLRWAGPDNDLEWDKLPGMAVYRSHLRDCVTASSHGGGTVHAYGVKVAFDSYGMDGKRPATSLSGKPYSVMKEAQATGLAVGIVNTGDLNEPGTGVFLASSTSRKASEQIVAQLLESGADIIMGGGEQWMLPANITGRHGPGTRSDDRNLIAEAALAGYTIVYNRDELARVPVTTRKLLGVFARQHTFHDRPEEKLADQKLPLYLPDAPSVAEMMSAALKIFAAGNRRFLLVVEEEGTDNFSNINNAAGTLEALRRADEAVGIGHRFVKDHPDTLLLMAADSDASGLQAIGYGIKPDANLPATLIGGAPLDGRDGTGSLPFETAPDAAGKKHPFAIAWIGPDDTYGAVLVRAAGLNADRVKGTFDNTDVYRLMYRTLFGRDLPSPVRND